MRRLCTESSCSYSGRSVWQAAGTGYGSRTEGHDKAEGSGLHLVLAVGCRNQL
jgi:hypothetical protein